MDVKLCTALLAFACTLSFLDKDRQESRERFEIESMVPLDEGLEVLLRVLSIVVGASFTAYFTYCTPFLDS